METKSSPQGTQPRRQAGLRADKLLISQGRRVSATPTLPAPPQPWGQTPGRVGHLCMWTDPSPFTLRLRVGGSVPLWLAPSPSCSSFWSVVRFWLGFRLRGRKGVLVFHPDQQRSNNKGELKGELLPRRGRDFFGGRGWWLEGDLHNPESLSYYHLRPLKLSSNFKHTIAIPNSRWVYHLPWSYQGGYSQSWEDMEKGVLKDE